MTQTLVETAKFCTSCGKEFQKGSIYCAYCGTALLPAKPTGNIVSATVVSKEPQTTIDSKRDSFFLSGWGRARPLVLAILWMFVLVTMFEEIYYAWAGSNPPSKLGPGTIFLAGILAAMYAPRRKYFGGLWFFLGVIGCILLMVLANVVGRLLR